MSEAEGVSEEESVSEEEQAGADTAYLRSERRDRGRLGEDGARLGEESREKHERRAGREVCAGLRNVAGDGARVAELE